MQNKLPGDLRKESWHPGCLDVKVITPKSSFISMATNISGNGLEVHCSKTVNPNTKLKISLQRQEEFVFHGTVMWTLGDFIDQHWVYRVGIKTDKIIFRDMLASSDQEKINLVQKILPQIMAKRIDDGEIERKIA